MEYRQLGQSGLRVSVLSLGTMTFGGETFFNKVGATDVKGARHQVDLCLERFLVKFWKVAVIKY